EIWGFRANGGGAEHMASYLRTFGGNFMDAEGVKCLFDQDESIQALRWLYDLQHEYEVDPCICGTDTANNFTAGQVGCFNWTTGYTATFYAQPAEEWTFEWDVMVPPVGPTGLRGSQVSAAAFCITGNSAHPFEAFQVLDFFSTKEDGIEHVFFGAGSPGGRQDVWESEELNSIHPIYRMHAEAFPDGPQPWYRAANARVGEFSDTMNNNLQAIWTDSIGFDEGVTQLYTLCQEVLDKDPL
ncbi:MAG: extracellular solute-binding protein, partial [Caldilineaceae bacterium]|nr:extracellular solute-binding protein [Caldilineaceae bacterium]